MIFAIAILSGGMLIAPLLMKARGGALSATGAVQLINRERAVVIDVREPDEFATGHIAGAKNVPLNDIDSRLPAVGKNKSLPYIFVCATGARAARGVSMAQKLGYEQAQALGGGMKAWKEANLPIEKA